MASVKAGHSQVTRAVSRYLALADRLLPDRICGFYVSGSTALGAFRPGRSDIDVVVVANRSFGPTELRRVRALQLLSGVRTALPAVARGDLALPGTVNGVYVARDDLTRPVTRIRPLVSHVGAAFAPGSGFDVNPVGWKVLAERGIAVRGPEPGTLGLDPEPGRLEVWNRENLHVYWKPYAEKILAGGGRDWFPLRRLPLGRLAAAWGVLGAPRLHHTIATGEVISKEAAGEYALDVFDRRWHPIVAEGLRYWRGEPADARFPDAAERSRQAAEFVLEVVADADR